VTGLVLAALLAVQGPDLDVTASVDRTHLTVGEQVTFTIQVRSGTGDVPGYELPPLAGFSVVGSRDATDVTFQGRNGVMRVAMHGLTLRAERPGRLTIGSVRVHVGESTALTAPITVTVDSAGAFPATTLSPAARDLLADAPVPQRNDRVALTLVLPNHPVRVGEQLDVVLAAWFPRPLRERLRRAPLLTLQTPEDVWAYPPSAPSDVVLSRRVHGDWMDLYAVHQILFPLAPGRLVVPPGSVDYALLVNLSYFSTEDRYTLTTDSLPIHVDSLPSAGRPADDLGVVAESLRVTLDLAPPEARVGEPLEVTTTLRGRGNVALWPPPGIAWPAGFRSYPEETTTRIESPGGRVGGTKSFRYLVMPDSAGTFLIPAVRYPYFDPGAGAYREVGLGPRSLIAVPGSEPRAARARPPLLSDAPRAWADRIAAAMGVPGWLAVLLLPPALFWWTTRRRRTDGAAARPIIARTPEATKLGRLEREFLTLLNAHVPDAATREGPNLARALRAAGVDRSLADHVVRLRDRLRAVRYAPRSGGDARTLETELERVLQRVLQALDVDGRGGSRRMGAGVGLALFALAILPGTRLAAQGGTSAEALYDAGALRAAADSFAARAAADTLNAAHWYDLGATLYRSGADGKAVAAWVKAQRLAPRDGQIGRARALLPSPDAVSGDLLAVGPVTPGECLLVAGAGWIAGWLVWLLWRRRVVAVSLLGVTVVAVVMGQLERRRRARPVAVVVAPGAPVRVAPYGSASASTVLAPGAAVLEVGRFAGGEWVRVERADGVNGWVQAKQVVRL
jgi:BatD DUF11 like domain